MKHEAEFREFLLAYKRSSRTGELFSLRVARDAITRCKLVERELGLELSKASVGKGSGLTEIINAIRARKLSSTESSPYAHNDLIYSIKIYREFLHFKKTTTPTTPPPSCP